VRAEKRFATGLQFQGNFTWASAFDFENSYFYWNHDLMYGRENNVRRFVFNFNGLYELPFGKGKSFLKTDSRAANLPRRVATGGGGDLGVGLSVHTQLRELWQRCRYRPVPRQPGRRREAR